jgi:arylsulfatase A-like enzyme
VPRISKPVANIDLAPTILELAGARPCATDRNCLLPDGRSLLPLLAGGQAAWPDDRGLLLELDDAFTYEAIRTPRYLYVELTADRLGRLPWPEYELYDLTRDPDQLHNLEVSDRASADELERSLAARLDALRRCAGTSGKRPCE